MTRVLHVLDHSLPLHSGYTFRTRAILKAQERAGIEVRGITGLRHTADGPAMEEAEGLTFHRTPANPDGTRETGGVPAVAEIREVNRLAKAIEDLAARTGGPMSCTPILQRFAAWLRCAQVRG